MTKKRNFVIGAISSVVLSSLMLTGCSSSEDGASTSTPAESYPSAAVPSASGTTVGEEPTEVVAPIMVAEGQETAQGPVGNYVVFNVADPGVWDILSENPEIVEVKKGGQEGTAVINPGGLLKAIGKTKVVLTNTETKKEWVINVSVVEAAPVLAEPGVAPPTPQSDMPTSSTPEAAPSGEASSASPAE